MLYFITLKLIVFILRVFFRFEVLGRENIPARGAFILASNHTTYFDPPILAAASVHRRLNFLAKEELFHNRLFAAYIRCLGAFPIKRNSNDIGAIKEAIRRIRKGQPLVIFPEGGRSKDAILREGSPGIALLAKKERIPIVPVYIDGAYTVSRKANAVKRHTIRVHIGKAFFFDKKDSISYEEITQKIMQAIKALSPNPLGIG